MSGLGRSRGAAELEHAVDLLGGQQQPAALEDQLLGQVAHHSASRVEAHGRDRPPQLAVQVLQLLGDDG